MSYGSGLVKFYETPENEARPVDDRNYPLPVQHILRTFDNPQVDAFGRLRTSDPVTLFDSKMLYDKLPLLYDETITDVSGNAASTHVAADAAVTMYVEAQDVIVRQSKMRFGYQSGKSQLVMLTGILTSGGTGITGRLGAFDGTNGLFFEVSGTTVSVAERKGGTDTKVAQADWNVDKLDGTGPSGITADWDKAQIFAIDYEWLSLGMVRYGLVFNGRIFYCHESAHVNKLTGAYMSTPNLPIRFSIESAAGGDSATMKQICSTVITEGGSPETGVIRTISTAGTHVDADAADSIYAIIGIKLKTTHLDSIVFVDELTVINENAQDYEYFLALNPTVAGVFTYAAVANSSLQFATGATANTVTADSWDIITSGGFVKSGTQGGGSVALQVPNALRLGSTIAGVPDALVLCARPLAANADIQATLTIREQI